jgi:hypothetical protein
MLLFTHQNNYDFSVFFNNLTERFLQGFETILNHTTKDCYVKKKVN